MPNRTYTLNRNVRVSNLINAWHNSSNGNEEWFAYYQIIQFWSTTIFPR